MCGVGDCDFAAPINFLKSGEFLTETQHFEMAPKHNTLKLPRALVDQLGGDGN